ncbi:MAG: hypothetical protein EOP87_21520 [Verrucomicrobiaceae bacterium]|nr:MAG: hypothetical protein EOP87_21520 [Verrucomicrobiaceae bacterium]
MTGPISSGDFDPLRPPGGNVGSNVTTTSAFKAGQFVRASMNNTAFFKNKPKGDGDADKLLTQGTSMKVISNSGSYVKVELDSGEVGFVPSVMLEDPNAVPGVPTTNPGEYQVYPPLPGTGIGEPLPPLDPTGLPPDGAIPTVIDPDAPASAPVPAVTPSTETFPAPVEPKVPLPPNGEELEAQGNAAPVEPKVETVPPSQ